MGTPSGGVVPVFERGTRSPRGSSGFGTAGATAGPGLVGVSRRGLMEDSRAFREARGGSAGGGGITEPLGTGSAGVAPAAITLDIGVAARGGRAAGATLSGAGGLSAKGAGSLRR